MIAIIILFPIYSTYDLKLVHVFNGVKNHVEDQNPRTSHPINAPSRMATPQGPRPLESRRSLLRPLQTSVRWSNMPSPLQNLALWSRAIEKIVEKYWKKKSFNDFREFLQLPQRHNALPN